MNINYLKLIVVVTAAGLFTAISVRASEAANVSQVSGEITGVELKLGKLQLKSDTSKSTEEITEYRINQNETRVTDPTDKKFVTIEDLQPGHYATIDVLNGKEEKIVQKITTDLRMASDYKESERQMNQLNEDLKNGKITQHEYDIRKDQIKKGSLLK